MIHEWREVSEDVLAGWKDSVAAEALAELSRRESDDPVCLFDGERLMVGPRLAIGELVGKTLTRAVRTLNVHADTEPGAVPTGAVPIWRKELLNASN